MEDLFGDIDKAKELTLKIAKIGVELKNNVNLYEKSENLSFPIQNIEFLKKYFDSNTKKFKNLDLDIGGKINKTLREVLTSMLLVNSVIDQGPDTEGVKILFTNVINHLYNRNIQIFHNPLEYFKNLNEILELIQNEHAYVSRERAEDWARINQSTPGKYNLFIDNSRQVLNYSIFRWGVPLSLSIAIQDHFDSINKYLESFSSAEKMCLELKSNKKYGLGKAIGNKACHLFAKWYIDELKLNIRKDEPWCDLSYESPFDSNCGRVLFRIGWLLIWATREDYINWKVIQTEKGKKKKDYIRVTNIRGKPVCCKFPKELLDCYNDVVINFLKANKVYVKQMQIQRMINTLLRNTKYTIGDFDNGIMYIGTQFCFNHNNPNCSKCPILNDCYGYNDNQRLINDYRT